MDYLLLLIGFVIIIVSSGILVDAASSVAIKLRVPKILIALTIVAFGTCMPELAISFNSIMGGNGDVALANVIGSCIINIVLVIGVAAIARPIRVKTETIKKQLPLLLVVTTVFSQILLFSFVKSDQVFHRIGGIMLVGLFGIFCYYIYKIFKKTKSDNKNDEPKYSFGLAIFLVILTLFLIAVSSNLVVEKAVIVASLIGVSEKVITMFVIVIGTSLPELVMTVTSAKRREFDFALGNIIGTNIFNICIVLGLPVSIFGSIQIMDFSMIDVIAVMLSVLMLYFFSKSDKKLTKIEGILMLAIFIMYYTYIILF